MEELNLVLDTVINTFSLFMPIMQKFHLLEIGVGALFVVCGLRLLIPILGTNFLNEEARSIPDRGRLLPPSRTLEDKRGR